MGSSRPMGDTYKVCKQLISENGYKFQDLTELVIMPFDYDYDNKDDDYMGFIKHVIDKYDNIILATPVYWYTMSGIMKNFVDRFTDLMTIQKEVGRRLRGKNLLYVSVSNSDDVPEEFQLPIKRTAEYLGMNFRGYRHFSINDDNNNSSNYAFVKEVIGNG